MNKEPHGLNITAPSVGQGIGEGLTGNDWIVINYQDTDTWPSDNLRPIMVRETYLDTTIETLRVSSNTRNELERGREGLLEWQPTKE